MESVLHVGMADLVVVKAPAKLITLGLGSCIGLVIFDSMAKVAGMAHIMLPDSNMTEAGQVIEPYRYADTGIILLVKKMEQLGANRIRMRAKIAGGAKIFPNVNDSAISNIGERNVAVVKTVLSQMRIRITADDTGKNFGRTVYFNAEDGMMKIKSTIKGEWTL